MTLHKPFIIGPRLLPALHIGDGFISYDFDTDLWYIDTPTGEHAIDDFRAGGGRSHMDDLQRSFASLLSFLEACVESRQYERRTGREGENSPLFPDHVAEWAEECVEEISDRRCEIEEEERELIQVV